MNDYQSWYEQSHLAAGNLGYINQLFESYLADRQAVPDFWRDYFDKLAGDTIDVQHQPIIDMFKTLARSPHTLASMPANDVCHNPAVQQLQLVQAYRAYGHHEANLDPLGLSQRRMLPNLRLAHWGLQADDPVAESSNVDDSLSTGCRTMQAVYERLRHIYCGSMGIEYLHITNPVETEWLANHLESTTHQIAWTADKRSGVLRQLLAATGLEKYLGFKYVGQKRFSLEGGEVLIPMLNWLIKQSCDHGVKEIVIGMAHRGRLNVLVNVLGKSPEMLFQEFEGSVAQAAASGDVKYHMGYSADIALDERLIHLALAFNPSHLEIIGPVVQGSVRARLRRRKDLEQKRSVLPVVIHGDAAFAGQGVVMETFNFSQAPGYATGGTLHVVVNNQIGFTTSNPLDARSTLYCTDIAKIVQAPIFHVNANDPEAAIAAMHMALAYRMKFKKDVVVDLVCYRRHGHNEADDPSVTQPTVYQRIRTLPPVSQLYAEQLVAEQVLTEAEVQAMADAYRDKLDAGEPIVPTVTGQYVDEFAVNWQPYLKKDWLEAVDTSLDQSTLFKLSEALHTLPDGFALHPTVQKLFGERQQMAQGELPINWGFAEMMAYASLAHCNIPVRLSGQDSGRGTFAHRHAIVYDQQTGASYTPMTALSGPYYFSVINSVLSEEAVLAFEYGFSTAEPAALVIWEAQFGDFANGAQVVIDQFISSGEQKWGRLSGLVMLLPHGYEGQGPEHSSARLERYLQLSAEHNIQIGVPTTPAQIFHLLRRQVLRQFRKPLIVMSPKSLLRHKLAVSDVADLTDGYFQLVIPEVDALVDEDVTKIILCSGKVYYDILQERRRRQLKCIAIIRIEQLYPFPEQLLREVLQRYPQARTVVWCQEEPQNQGAWYASQHHLRACLRADQMLHYVGRDPMAAPAAGSYKLFLQKQRQVVDTALEPILTSST